MQGMKIFETWVVEFRDASPSRVNALVELIKCLRTGPLMSAMDVGLLKASGIGAAIGKLRKHEDAKLKAEATALVEQWKKLVDAAKDKGEAVVPLKKKAEGAPADVAAKRAKKVRG